VTATGQFVGSLPWASPEQAAGDTDRIDIRTDVYALGVMMYRALAGRFPYTVVGNMADVLRKIQTSDPPPLRIRPPHANGGRTSAADAPALGRAGSESGGRPINRDVDTIVRKCLAKACERRYQNAGEVAADLRHYLAGEPIEARRDSTWYVLRKQLRRYRWVAVVAAAFVISTSALTLWALREARTSRALARSEASARARAQHEAEQRRRESYASAILAADAAFQAGDIGAMQDALAKWADEPEFHNNWEYRYLRRLSDQSIATFDDPVNGHRREANAVAISPDGNIVASVGAEGEVILWDFATQRLLSRWDAHRPSANRVWFSHDGTRLATGGSDGVVRVWDVASRQCVAGSPGALVGMTSNSACLLVRPGVGLTEWDPDANEEQSLLSGDFENAVASLDGRLVGATRGGRVTVAAPSNHCGRTFERNDAVALAISDHGDSIAFGYPDGHIELVESSSPEGFLKLAGHTAPVRSMAFSSDGGWLVSSSDDLSIRVWSTARGTCRRVLHGHRLPASKVVFCLGSDRIVSSGEDKLLKVWDLEGHSPEVVLNATDDSAMVLDCRDDRAARAGGSRTVALRDLRCAGFRPGPESEEWVTAAGFSPDGSVLAIGTKLGHVEVRKPKTLELLRHLGQHAFAVEAIGFSPDGRRLATASVDDTVAVWNAATWEQVHALRHEVVHDEHGGDDSFGVNSVAFSPDGRLLASASHDRTVRLWDVETGQPIGKPLDFATKALAVTFSPDGRYILAGGASDADYTLKLWDAGTFDCVRTLSGHTMDVYAVSFSPDGSHFLSGAADGTVRIWHTTGEIGGQHPLLTLRRRSNTSSRGVESAGFLGPDGNRIRGVYGDGELWVWDCGG